jgi:uncharacterized protein with HEPN domain
MLGDAGARVSEEFRQQHPEIDWRKIIGLRNIIIHRYEKVDAEMLWEIIVSILPALSNQLEQLHKELES